MPSDQRPAPNWPGRDHLQHHHKEYCYRWPHLGLLGHRAQGLLLAALALARLAAKFAGSERLLDEERVASSLVGQGQDK